MWNRGCSSHFVIWTPRPLSHFSIWVSPDGAIWSRDYCPHWDLSNDRFASKYEIAIVLSHWVWGHFVIQQLISRTVHLSYLALWANLFLFANLIILPLFKKTSRACRLKTKLLHVLFKDFQALPLRSYSPVFPLGYSVLQSHRAAHSSINSSYSQLILRVLYRLFPVPGMPVRSLAEDSSVQRSFYSFLFLKLLLVKLI